jgi:hypothetical protein
MKHMTGAQRDIELAKIASEAVAHFGNAAWKCPDQVTSMMSQLAPFLRVGPTSAQELLEQMEKAPGKKGKKYAIDS